MATVFVFGSNLAGRHGKGAALHARKFFAAQYGVGEGRTGDAYAIPTKDANLSTLPLQRIKQYVEDFILYARDHPEDRFELTRIGCGLAGYSDIHIAPLFKEIPSNCTIPNEWKDYVLHAKHER